MRFRTETSRFLVVQNQTGRLDPESLGSLKTCPACGRELIASAKTAAILPPPCPEKHEENDLEGVLEPKKMEE
jgi:hypothetical protein